MKQIFFTWIILCFGTAVVCQTIDLQAPTEGSEQIILRSQDNSDLFRISYEQ